VSRIGSGIVPSLGVASGTAARPMGWPRGSFNIISLLQTT